MKKYFKSLLAVVIAVVVFVPGVKAATVTFDTDGGSAIEPQEVENGNKINLPANPTKEGFVFVGWYTLGGGDVKIPFNSEYDYIYDDTTLHANWVTQDHIIKAINLTLSKPAIGDNISPDIETEITAETGAKYGVMRGFFITNFVSAGDFEEYNGKFEAGKTYYYEFQIDTNSEENGTAGYYFDNNLVININGKPVEYETVWGEVDYRNLQVKIVNSDETLADEEEQAAPQSTAADSEEKTAYKVLDGDKQTYQVSSDENLTFRFDIAYSEFLASGKVYMDNEEVNKENYATKEGSTYVIFTKAYSKKLSEGEHTMKVTTDNGEATTTFTIKAPEVATAKKTAKTSNPQTGDNVYTYISLLLISVLGFISFNIYNRKVSE